MNIEQAIRDYLPGIIHLSLATCHDGRPWVCEVHFAYDQALNLYFRSLASRRHSKELAANPSVAGNIVIQHAPSEKPLGVYFEGRAELLEGVNEQHPAYQAYSERFGRGQEMLEEAARADGTQFYQITVTDFYMFDARNTKPAQKYHLAWRDSSAQPMARLA